MSFLRQWWLNGVCASPLIGSRVRVRLLRIGGVQVGLAGVQPYVRFIDGFDVVIGDGASLNVGIVLSARARIEIGSYVGIGANSILQTATHVVGPQGRRASDGISGPIKIGDGCWLGAGVVVLPGITIGDGCVIAAGSVVTSDCAPNGLYAGVPALRKRELPEASADQVSGT